MREIAQAADLITGRLRVAIHMASAGQEVTMKTNIELAISACTQTLKKLEALQEKIKYG